jgi:hypothetical protein
MREKHCYFAENVRLIRSNETNNSTAVGGEHHFHHPVYDLVDGGIAAFLHINIRLRR